jgi:hypothetical protein
MSDLQRWKPTNGDKMEVSDDGKYVKLYDYFIIKCIADDNALKVEQLRIGIAFTTFVLCVLFMAFGGTAKSECYKAAQVNHNIKCE